MGEHEISPSKDIPNIDMYLEPTVGKTPIDYLTLNNEENRATCC